MKKETTKVRAVNAVIKSRLMAIPEDQELDEYLKEKSDGYANETSYLLREGRGKIEELPPLLDDDDRQIPLRMSEKVAIKKQDFESDLYRAQLYGMFGKLFEAERTSGSVILSRLISNFYRKHKANIGIDDLKVAYDDFRLDKSFTEFAGKLIKLYRAKESCGSREFVQKEQEIWSFYVKHQKDINLSNFWINGDTPLSIAIKSGGVNLAEYFIDDRVNLAQRLGENCDSYLHLAIANNQMQIAEMLVDAGIETEVINTFYDTPLMMLEKKIAEQQKQEQPEDLSSTNLRTSLRSKFVESYNEGRRNRASFYGDEVVDGMIKTPIVEQNILDNPKFQEHLRSLIAVEKGEIELYEVLRRRRYAPQATVSTTAERTSNLMNNFRKNGADWSR